MRPVAAKVKWESQLFFGGLVAVLFTAIVAAFIFVISTIVISEQAAQERERRSVDRVFQNSKTAILREIERYAASNNAYMNIATRFSLAWVEQRFGRDMAADFNHDFILLMDPDGALVFRQVNGVQSSNALDGVMRDGDLPSLLASIRGSYLRSLSQRADGEVVFKGRQSDVSGVAVVDLAGRVGLAAAYAIVPDPGGIPMEFEEPYILVAIHVLDEAHLQDLLSALSLTGIFAEDHIPVDMVGLPIRDKTGTVLAYLVWEPVSDASRVILAWAPLLTGALLFILLLTMYALRQNYRATVELRQREQEAIMTSRRDALTGLARRDLFYEDAGTILLRQARKNCCSAVLYIDLDFLKTINDAHGHTIGDKLINATVALLKEACDGTDLLGRIGGDEFLLLLTDRNSSEEVLREVEDLCRNVNGKVEIDGLSLPVSCSIGVALCPEHGRDLPKLVRSADIALQRCKSGGRGTFRVYDADMDEALHEKRRIQRDLKQAIENDEFEVYYQPIVDAKSGQISFAEALIRWNHPKKGLLAPGAFLQAAEENGTIDQIGAWVLQQSIRDAAGWLGTGVSVNVCASQLLDDNFVTEVARLLDLYGLPPERLVLEITESVMMDRSETIRTAFSHLAELGVAIAIDDFGTGFSSLSYLHEYRFQKLKIDRSFISRIETDPDAGTIIRTMIGLARVLGMTVVAEGVETEEQRLFLKRAQCTYLQGYLFNKPAPLSELTQKFKMSA